MNFWLVIDKNALTEFVFADMFILLKNDFTLFRRMQDIFGWQYNMWDMKFYLL